MSWAWKKFYNLGAWAFTVHICPKTCFHMARPYRYWYYFKVYGKMKKNWRKSEKQIENLNHSLTGLNINMCSTNGRELLQDQDSGIRSHDQNWIEIHAKWDWKFVYLFEKPKCNNDSDCLFFCPFYTPPHDSGRVLHVFMLSHWLSMCLFICHMYVRP